MPLVDGCLGHKEGKSCAGGIVGTARDAHKDFGHGFPSRCDGQKLFDHRLARNLYARRVWLADLVAPNV